MVALVFNWLCANYFKAGRTNIVYDAIYFIVGGLIFLYRKELAEFASKHKVIAGAILLIATVAYFALGGNTLTMLFFCVAALVYTLGCKRGGGTGQSSCQVPRWNLLRDLPVFFVGRGIDYAVCLEGSLKLKEISYIHSEAYAAGELKHGTISLIEHGTLVIGVLTQSELYEKTISNMLECKSRGAYLMGLTTYGKYEIEDQVNFTVYVPKVDEHFVGSLAVIPLQLLGYYVSVAKGLDVDKPRNLAKSVTVE